MQIISSSTIADVPVAILSNLMVLLTARPQASNKTETGCGLENQGRQSIHASMNVWLQINSCMRVQLSLKEFMLGRARPTRQGFFQDVAGYEVDIPREMNSVQLLPSDQGR
ncbi:hypothetical protein D8674_038922 [Pyrus ussuriensis x Pyrus communis]|uniref:Uncharacterized protein n=1 Tax=Pyrus ussuriensis x Pyrus communis TaxID=2448454 RepID=A0A5N5FQ98_9ROSA|nr:hypothetical protein D8674_037752 [Pyrus ussuriensis x Pyrus communis]KAB2634202.1 hypothetical protein D8674_038922 [Pyrus ussuriensis x Pyrus communis]